MDIKDLIVALGDTTAVARALQEPVTTVQSWKTAGRIPRWRQASVVALAITLGVDISDSELAAVASAASEEAA